MLGALNIDQQRAHMKAVWPKFTERGIDRKLQEVRWVGTYRPQFVPFTLELRYRLLAMPEVRVLNPMLTRLPNNPEGELPHVYPPADDPTLCLFDPRESQWEPTMYLADTIVPWAFDWVACYELWLMTGRWTGGGRHGSAVPSRIA